MIIEKCVIVFWVGTCPVARDESITSPPQILNPWAACYFTKLCLNEYLSGCSLINSKKWNKYEVS